MQFKRSPYTQYGLKSRKMYKKALIRRHLHGRFWEIKKKLLSWLSGLWTGILVGAAVACPAKEVSIPVSLVLAVVFAVLSK